MQNRRFTLAVLLLLAVSFHANAAVAQESKTAEPVASSSDSKDQLSAKREPTPLFKLIRGIEAALTIWTTKDGRVVHVGHCRAVRDGCRSRIAIFARWLHDTASANNIDPFLLTAIALRESGLNPFAEGLVGEMGIVQLHPGGVGKRAKFVTNDRYRERCRRRRGACQREILELGAEHLGSAISRCGSVEAGLGAYNRGKCGATEYSDKVLEGVEQLKKMATGELPPAGGTAEDLAGG